ncbi:MAG: TRAP transporter substrate-binding protein DctP [Planctomycetaceae bacterium]|nr:TRAP transporter substrate-binding protein DctP [Planctomycetaceae bacterium]
MTANPARCSSPPKINLKGLGYTENGFRQLTANKPIMKPEDLAGIKLRVMENKIQMATWRTLGANPTPVSFGELFTALQQRTVDAQENPFELIYTNKFYEVQNYVMTTNHIYTPMPIFMNLEF